MSKVQNNRTKDVEMELYFDEMCEVIRGHPVFDIGDRLLDWRNNQDDREKLISCIQGNIDFLKSPCKVCGDPIHICEKNPDTNHSFLVEEIRQ